MSVKILSRRENKLRYVRKTITFTGGSGAGAVGSVSVFTVTGAVLLALVTSQNETSLTEAAGTATLAMGVTGKTTLIMTAINAVNLTTDKFWDANAGTSQAVANGVAVDAAQKDVLVTDDVLLTVGAQAVDGGVLRVEVAWIPMSSDGNVAPA